MPKWKEHRALLDYFAEPKVDHFGVVERLANKESQIFKKVRDWIL